MGRLRAGYWDGMIAEYRASGQSQEEFCRRRGLSVHSLRAWLYQRPLQAARAAVRSGLAAARAGLSARLDAAAPVGLTGGRAPVVGGGGFVQVAAVADDPAAELLAAPLEVLLNNGRKVAVRPGFDAATLQQVVALLEEAPC